ncbi:copper chaperone CopZ [Bacillus sp. JCM 19034]|uniref:copper chaperone CopZ n=1 Tax=Bacillus sp. JCM 19034 TaxID=1481928 RepID=UPI0007816E8A|nr:copper chaperone CopZ [Bacillus sp. JCM 19034]
MDKIKLHVQGMSCSHCISAIEGSVSQLNGVKMVEVQLDQQTVTVAIDSSLITTSEIKNAIEDQGYDVID